MMQRYRSVKANLLAKLQGFTEAISIRQYECGGGYNVLVVPASHRYSSLCVIC